MNDNLIWHDFPIEKKKLMSTVGSTGPNGFHNYCDWCIGCRLISWDELPYNYCWGNPRELPKVIFVACFSIRLFFNDIYPFIPKEHSYVLVIGDEDTTVPLQMDIRYPKDQILDPEIWEELTHNKQISHIFVSHLDIPATDIYSPIPVGFNPIEHTNNDIDTLLEQSVNDNIMTRPLKVRGCCRIREGSQWDDRVTVKNLCETEWSEFADWDNVDTHLFFDEIQKYSFLLCPHGGGIEPNPKAFSAIYCYTIPIMKKFVNCEILYHDLPVIFIDDWSTQNINLEKLKEWREELKPYFFEKRESVLEKLTADYWFKKVVHKLV